MRKQAVAERISRIAADAAAESGLELVQTEITGSEKQPLVRIYIDKPEGVTHEDCAAVSRRVGDVLDAEDFIAAAYTLEVSSPGLERGLYKREDFARFAGSLARIKTFAPINGQRNFRGRILSIEGEEIVFDDRTNGEVRIPHPAVAKANIEIDVEEEFKKAEMRKTESAE